ncbi:MAG: homoserine O-succinyltransferase, partial [Proteobacteria bacterium]|nr:homoserine O-succinyltransferase [Pseudomonadota bacterium]
MPIKIPDALPAAEVLQRENIFTIESSQAEIQD